LRLRFAAPGSLLAAQESHMVAVGNKIVRQVSAKTTGGEIDQPPDLVERFISRAGGDDAVHRGFLILLILILILVLISIRSTESMIMIKIKIKRSCVTSHFFSGFSRQAAARVRKQWADSEGEFFSGLAPDCWARQALAKAENPHQVVCTTPPARRAT